MITISFKTNNSEAFCPWCKARIEPARRQYERQCNTCGSYFQLRDEFDEQRAAEPENCANCRFWFKTDNLGALGVGICRVHPPRRKHEPVYGDWWCGDGRAKL